MKEHVDHDDFGGLQRDLRATGQAIDRRKWLSMAARLGAGVGAFHLGGCGGSPTTPSAASSSSSAAPNVASANPSSASSTANSSSAGLCTSKVPEETAGPYPGDSSNGPNVLNLSGVVRNDIRSSFAGLNGTAPGVPLTLVLAIVSASNCATLGGRAVYLWHCDRVGNYSLYSAGATNQNYLRGVQEADANGTVTFTTIYPGCYSGRWPHIHFEVYPSLTAATSVSNKMATSQIAMPKTSSDLVYATSGYEASVRNLSQVTLASDNVFSDGASLELATVTGSVSGGLTATLTVAI
jgi:protocatechuate 3,4-dioxygenase beta subunit